MKFSLSFYNGTLQNIQVVLLVSGGPKRAKYTLIFKDGQEIGGTCTGTAAAIAQGMNIASANVGHPVGYVFAYSE